MIRRRRGTNWIANIAVLIGLAWAWLNREMLWGKFMDLARDEPVVMWVVDLFR